MPPKRKKKPTQAALANLQQVNYSPSKYDNRHWNPKEDLKNGKAARVEAFIKAMMMAMQKNNYMGNKADCVKNAIGPLFEGQGGLFEGLSGWLLSNNKTEQKKHIIQYITTKMSQLR